MFLWIKLLALYLVEFVITDNTDVSQSEMKKLLYLRTKDVYSLFENNMLTP